MRRTERVVIPFFFSPRKTDGTHNVVIYCRQEILRRNPKLFRAYLSGQNRIFPIPNYVYYYCRCSHRIVFARDSFGEYSKRDPTKGPLIGYIIIHRIMLLLLLLSTSASIVVNEITRIRFTVLRVIIPLKSRAQNTQDAIYYAYQVVLTLTRR